MAFALTVTVNHAYTGTGVADYPVEVCSDEAGATVLFREYTDTTGVATFSVSASTIYLFGRGAYYTVDNPTEVVIAAATAETLEVTPIDVTDGDATGICNGAILLVGAGKEGVDHIDSYENDIGDLADWCRRRYDLCRKRALMKHRWNEAVKLLAGDDGSGDDDTQVHTGYDYAYALPSASGCIALRGIVDSDGEPVKHKRAGSYIHADAETDEFWWDFVNDLQTGFSPGLQRCIEYEMALDLCGFLLTGNAADAKRRTLYEEYAQIVLPQAKMQNADEQYDTHNQTKQERWDEVESETTEDTSSIDLG